MAINIDQVPSPKQNLLDVNVSECVKSNFLHPFEPTVIIRAHEMRISISEWVSVGRRSRSSHQRRRRRQRISSALQWHHRCVRCCIHVVRILWTSEMPHDAHYGVWWWRFTVTSSRSLSNFSFWSGSLFFRPFWSEIFQIRFVQSLPTLYHIRSGSAPWKVIRSNYAYQKTSTSTKCENKLLLFNQIQ